MKNNREQKESGSRLEGRNAVLEALRSGRTVDKLYVQVGNHDGPIQTILREAKKQGSVISFVTKERLNQMSETGNHQGVIALAASYQYAEVEEILKRAREKNEPPFLTKGRQYSQSTLSPATALAVAKSNFSRYFTSLPSSSARP